MVMPFSRTGFAFALMMALLGDFPASAAHKGTAGRAGESIKFSPPGGVFTNGLVVQITSAAGSSSPLHYTLDGSEPTLRSPLYSSPIAISNTVLVRVRAASGSNSVVSSETYVFIDSDLAGFNSNLPLMIINSFGQEIVKEEKAMVSARLIQAEGARYSISGPAEFSGRALINIRGRASLRYPKRSYTIRPIDEQDEFLKISPLGLPADSDWVLYAPYPDKTFMRDVLAYDLSNKIGQYAARTRFIELFVNETSERLSKTTYMGVYVLEEKIRRGKDRVNIEKLGPDDNAEPKITGGYIFKKDHEVDGDEGAQPNIGGFPGNQGSTSSYRLGFPTGPGGFPADPAGFLPPYNGPIRESSSSSSTTRRTSSSSSVTNRVGMIPEETDEFVSYRFNSSRSLSSSHERFVSKPRTNEFYYAYPEPDEITAAQRAWLMAHINKTETVLYGKNFLDRTNGYRAYIDPASFIDHHIIVELSKNVDGFRFSTFFHKDRGGKIKMGPVWDWNLSFGNANAKQGWLPEYWLWPQLNDKEYSWFRRLFEDPDFGQQYVDRWAQLRTNVLATTNVMAGINARTNLLQEAQVRNYERWPVLGRQVWPQYFVGNSYAEEVEFMKDWITKRLAWIDAQFVAAPEAKSDGGKVALAATGGEIIFTLDGSDPRLPGGGISPSATKYSGPLQSQPKALLFARALKDKRWSAPTIRSF